MHIVKKTIPSPENKTFPPTSQNLTGKTPNAALKMSLKRPISYWEVTAACIQPAGPWPTCL